jgi:hypothetical protein
MRNKNKQRSVAGRLGQACRRSALASASTQATGRQGRRRDRPLKGRGLSQAVGDSLACPCPQIPLALADSASIESILEEIDKLVASRQTWDKIQPLVEWTIDQARSEDLDTQLTVVRNALNLVLDILLKLKIVIYDDNIIPLALSHEIGLVKRQRNQ